MMTTAAIVARCGEIRTGQWPTPADWAAWFDGRGEEWITAYGRTEAAAIEELLAEAEERLEDERDREGKADAADHELTCLIEEGVY